MVNNQLMVDSLFIIRKDFQIFILEAFTTIFPAATRPTLSSIQ